MLSLPLQNTHFFDHVSKHLNMFFSEGILERNKVGILFVLGLRQERERAG